MRKIIFAGIFVLLLSACSNSEKASDPKSELEKVDNKIETDKEINSEIDVTLDLEIIKNEGKVSFLGETNLPDETEIMITLSNENGYRAQDKINVQDRIFESNTFSDKSSFLSPGKYNVEITTPTANVQPESVKGIIGDNGVNLVGDLIKNDPTFGNMLDFKESFTIEDQTETGKQEPSEDDIYNFMLNKYDEITNYGANYIPEIHDPQVARLASEKFCISEEEAGQIYVDKEMSKFN